MSWWDDDPPADEEGGGDEPVEGGGNEDAGEHAVPPSTWAGRERAREQESSGFTEEFDAIERELDAELESLGTGEYAVTDEDKDGGPEDAGDAVAPAPEAGEPPAAKTEPTESREAEREPAESSEAEPKPAEPDVDVGEKAAEDAQAPAEPQTAEDAALAGLRARAAGKDSWEGAAAGATEETAGAVAPAAATTDTEAEPRRKPPALWARFLAASLIIVASMAAATSISALVFLTDLVKGFGGIEGVEERLVAVDGGDPQTILILGSDERASLEEKGRSDTTILLRVDPDNDLINLLSIPRDLKVTIPGHGVDKFNAAYSVDGPRLTLRVVQQLTGLDIHHVVNVDFTGFADAVNALNCVFIDVDRQYYVPEGFMVGGQQYSAIDPPINAGYQKLCGLRALQYVRYRLGDNDLVRSARQQDFIREARQKVEPKRLLLDKDYRYELLKVFKDHTTSDNSLRDTGEVLAVMKTFLGAHDATVNEIPFPAQLGETYVGYQNKSLQAAINEFLGNAEEESEPAEPKAEEESDPDEYAPVGGNDEKGGSDDKGSGEGRKDDGEKPAEPALIDATGQSEPYARSIAKWQTKGGEKMVRFPIFYPTQLPPNSTLADETRAFPIDGPKRYYGYKLVVQLSGDRTSVHGLTQEYYGISGTNWDDPPILENPSETREIDGREYLLFYDGGRLRLVGWKEKGSAYWVINSLLQTLEEGEMLAIARSMRERGG